MYRASTLLQTDNLFNSVTTADISASGHVIAAVFKPKPNATITHICVYCLSITSPPVLKVSLQTTTGTNPSGTDITGASTTFTPTAATYYELQLGTPYTTPNPSTLISACISYSSGTVGASNKATFYYRTPGNRILNSWARNFTTAWDSTLYTPAIFVKYSDGTYDNLDTVSMIAPTQINIGSAQTYDEVGNRLIIPIGYECVGFVFGARFQTTTVEIYPKVVSATRGTLLDDTNLKISGSQVVGTSSIYMGTFEFPTPLTIAPMEQVDFTIKNIASGTTGVVYRSLAYSSETFKHILGFKSADAIAISLKSNVLLNSSVGLYELMPIVRRVNYERHSINFNGGLV